MIENHLYSLVTVVKYKLLPCLLAIFLTGCDRTEVTLSFTPEGDAANLLI
ncbi:YnfC family lipoprotein [Escherichia coli]